METHALIKLIFGKPVRFYAAAWIAARPAGAFFALGDMQPAFPAWERDRSAVHASLRQLLQQGLLLEVSPMPGRVQYTRTESPVWKGYAAFAAALDEVRAAVVVPSAAVDTASAPPPLALLPPRRATRAGTSH